MPPLEQGGTITGRVTDSGGNPLANVNVSAQTAPCCSGPGASASTDPAGNYTIIGLPTGNYQVHFSTPFTTADWSVSTTTTPPPPRGDAGRRHARPGDRRINASLNQGGSITGHVTDSGGNPLANVNVSAQTAPCCGGRCDCQHQRQRGLHDHRSAHRQLPGPVHGAFGTGLSSEYFDNATNSSTATPVAVTLGQVTARSMPHSTRADRSPVASPTAVESGWPTSLCPPKPRRVAGPVGVPAPTPGNYTIIGLPAGNYQVQFTALPAAGCQ